MKNRKEYAAYRGDTLVFLGTKSELLETLNITSKFFNYAKAPISKRRADSRDKPSKALIIVEIEFTEEELFCEIKPKKKKYRI